MEHLFMENAQREYECKELEVRCERARQELQESEAARADIAKTRQEYELKAKPLFRDLNEIQRRWILLRRAYCHLLFRFPINWSGNVLRSSLFPVATARREPR